jgi:putative SOS response-associated peptidase YedK
MCGRFAINVNVDEVVQAFKVQQVVQEFKPNYNVAPTHKIPVVLEADGQITLDAFRWGLIPHWAKDKKIGYKMINARAETLEEKPSFRAAYKKRRCIIIASGFYEWKRTKDKKLPYYIYPKKGFFAFAGLYEKWQDVNSCTIITTDANSVVGKLHNRMPVVVEATKIKDWLNPDNDGELSKYFKPYPATKTAMYPVSTMVNSVKNNTPECMEKSKQQTLA